MVLFGLAPVSKQVDIRPLVLRQVAAAGKGQGAVPRLLLVVQDGPALPGHFREAEQHHQIPLTRLGKALQQFRAAGGQQAHREPQPPQPELQQLPQGGRGAFPVDEHPLRLQQGLDRLLKDGGVQGLQGFLQAELLPG